MKVLLLDPFHGAAGDMITGALLDCGADRERVVRAMASVVAEPAVTRVTRAGISALMVETRAMPAHRTIAEVMERLDTTAGAVPEDVLIMARRVFERIHAAEEAVHGRHPHFHEVGADDAIADVIGACTALYTLGVEGVAVLPVALGQGMGSGSHGMFPLPAPATVAILNGSGLVVVPGVDDGELCTPTGAALLAEFSTVRPGDIDGYTIRAVGYGAGSRDSARAPNVLRAMVVETVPAGSGFLPGGDCVDILETNVDDVSGEVIAHALARFMEAGARDASALPVIMKKGRPGFLIRVICSRETSTSMAGLMARELGTLGIRCIPSVHRFIAERTTVQVDVRIGGHRRSLPVKCGRMGSKIYTLKAEFDCARDWAAEIGVPVQDVLRAAEEAGWRQVRISQKLPGDR
jgi:hypothetical protein